MIGANPAGLACEINLLKSLVPERADHSRSVDYLVYSVKRHLRWWDLPSRRRPSARETNGDGFLPFTRRKRRMGQPA
jgi:hypothetical protein